MTVARSPSTPVSQTLWVRGGKRIFDLIFSILFLILLSPLILLAIVLIALTSPGPILFRQSRAGRDGKSFELLKLRTMRPNRTPDPSELVPLDHPEITRVGWVLRRFKIDEAPQLLCVIRGDMSLIGPRPTLLDQVEKYDDFRRRRLSLLPGITGLAQVYGNTTMSWDERILYDVAYVRCCSFGLDAFILLRTLGVIVLGEQRMSRKFAQTRYRNCVEPPADYPIGC